MEIFSGGTATSKCMLVAKTFVATGSKSLTALLGESAACLIHRLRNMKQFFVYGWLFNASLWGGIFTDFVKVSKPKKPRSAAEN